MYKIPTELFVTSKIIFVLFLLVLVVMLMLMLLFLKMHTVLSLDTVFNA